MNILLIIDYIGYFGPLILFILTCIFLLNKKTYLAYYIVGTILNIGLNIILKQLIKDPRPNQDKKLFEIMLKNGERINADKYGMPSGHAQGVGFSLIFIYLVTQNAVLTNIYLIISILTVYQRYKYNNHTISQLVIGLLTGLSFGYLCYYLCKKNIIGKIKDKKDDNGPR
jgi:membrane-associated phospholipid phosphatase